MFYVELWICISIKVEVVICVSFVFCVFMILIFIKFMIYLFKNDYLFLFFTHLTEINYEKWSSWNSFIRINIFFLIIIYDFHDFCLYFSYLIRSSNHASWIHHLMLLIKLIKYKSSLLSIIIDDDSDTCCLTESCFKNNNKLI